MLFHITGHEYTPIPLYKLKWRTSSVELYFLIWGICTVKFSRPHCGDFVWTICYTVGHLPLYENKMSKARATLAGDGWASWNWQSHKSRTGLNNERDNWHTKQYALTRQINYTQSRQQIERVERAMLHLFLEINVIGLLISISILGMHKNVTYRPTSIYTRSFNFLMDVNTRRFESRPNWCQCLLLLHYMHSVSRKIAWNHHCRFLAEVPQNDYSQLDYPAWKQKFRDERSTLFLVQFHVTFPDMRGQDRVQLLDRIFLEAWKWWTQTMQTTTIYQAFHVPVPKSPSVASLLITSAHLEHNLWQDVVCFSYFRRSLWNKFTENITGDCLSTICS